MPQYWTMWKQDNFIVALAATAAPYFCYAAIAIVPPPLLFVAVVPCYKQQRSRGPRKRGKSRSRGITHFIRTAFPCLDYSITTNASR